MTMTCMTHSSAVLSHTVPQYTVPQYHSTTVPQYYSTVHTTHTQYKIVSTYGTTKLALFFRSDGARKGDWGAYPVVF